jgi:alpha-tubulin suppressor-like RCC1 family protein
VVGIAAGRAHTCAWTSAGKVRCWGRGAYGRLGYGNTDTIGDNESPRDAGDVEVGGTVVQMALGHYHTCALLDTGAVRCWGENFTGQLGLPGMGNVGDDEYPSDAPEVVVGGIVTKVTAGYRHTCALLDSGYVRCWGEGLYGSLGYGNTFTIGDDEVPASVGNAKIGVAAKDVVAGYLHTCAISVDGAVRCWGQGGLGYGDVGRVGDDETPASMGDVQIGGKAMQITAGGDRTCIVLETQAVRCWGQGSYGSLGYPGYQNVGIPIHVGTVEIGGAVGRIESGEAHNCALLESGSVRCFGDGWVLGYGNTSSIGDDETPASAGDVSLGQSAVQIATGERHSCALLTDGSVRCWGANTYGQLGLGHTDRVGDDELPTDVEPVDIL